MNPNPMLIAICFITLVIVVCMLILKVLFAITGAKRDRPSRDPQSTSPSFKPELLAVSKRVFLRRSCAPIYWETFFGQQEMLDMAASRPSFKPILPPIIELSAGSKKLFLRRSCAPIYWETFFGQQEMLCLAKKKSRHSFKPQLESIMERRFVRIRRPSKRTDVSSTQQVEDEGPKLEETMLDTCVDYANPVETMRQATIANESWDGDGDGDDNNTQPVVPPLPPLRRSARIRIAAVQGQTTNTQSKMVLLGSITFCGRRRSARVAKLPKRQADRC